MYSAPERCSCFSAMSVIHSRPNEVSTQVGLIAVAGDTVGGSLERDRSGQTDHCGFGSAVSTEVTAPTVAAVEAMLMIRPHFARSSRQRLFDRPIGAGEVDVDDLVP